MDSFQAFELAHELSPSAIRKRQQGILAIPTTYLGLNAGPKPAILVAIVLGAIAGFLLICSLIYAIASLGGGRFNRKTTVIEEEVISRRSSAAPSRRREERQSSSRRRPRVRETTRGGIEAEDVSLT